MPNCLQFLMGQSITPPTNSKNRQANSRLSARSLQRSTRSSVFLERQLTRSASKMGPFASDNSHTHPTHMGPQGAYSERQEQEHHYDDGFTLKRDNKMEQQRSSMRGDESVYSPNFKQIAEGDQDYCLSEWKTPTEVKALEKSQSNTHQDITISFSKTKNLNSNHIHEQTLVSKENLFKILEDHQNSQVQEENHSRVLNSSTEQSVQPKQINQKNLTTAQRFYQIGGNMVNNDRSVTKQVVEDRMEVNRITKQIILDHKQKKSIIKQPIVLPSSNNIEFNDYDSPNFIPPNKNIEGAPKRKIKLSKNLQEVKQKLITVSHTSQLKNSLLKTSSLHNLSRSLRSVKCDGVSNDVEKKNHQNNEQKNLVTQPQQSKKHQSAKIQVLEPKSPSKNTHLIQRRSFVNSPRNNDKNQNNKERSSHLIIFNDSSAYVYPNLLSSKKSIEVDQKLSVSHGTESSISDLIKKTSLQAKAMKNSMNNEPLKKPTEIKNDFNKKSSTVYQPIEGEQYDLIGIKSPKRPKLVSPKLDYKQKAPTQQLVTAYFKPLPHKAHMAILQKVHETKIDTKLATKDQKNKGICCELKKRYKSSEGKNSLNSKLLIF